MEWLTIKTFRERCFTDEDRPCRVTVQRWITKGLIPATKMGRTWYINPDSLKDLFKPQRVPGVVQPSTNAKVNEAVARVLAK